MRRSFHTIMQVAVLVCLLAPLSGHAADVALSEPSAQPAQGELRYDNATLGEDVTWRGNVMVRGSLVVPPQVTLRIEAGTIVRFGNSSQANQSRLVVQGRLLCSGTAERPVLLLPASGSGREEWGGVMLLSSEKRNQVDYLRIEGAEVGVAAYYSSLQGRGVTVVRSTTAMLLRDSLANLTALTVNGCGTALEIHDSELELREGVLEGNRRGVVAQRAGLALASLTVRDSQQQGLQAEECRLKLSGCTLTGNQQGAVLTGGEGQVLLSRFTGNRDCGLQLSGSRLKINRSLFGDNARDGLRVAGGQAVVWDSVFSGNKGHNLANTGPEAVAAVLNWWGSNDEAAIMAGLADGRRQPGAGVVTIAPWLTEKPKKSD